jgi:endonuclease-3
MTKNKDPNKVENDLLKIIPRDKWLYVNHLLVDHGRALCKAPTPICSRCPLNETCPKEGVMKMK